MSAASRSSLTVNVHHPFSPATMPPGVAVGCLQFAVQDALADAGELPFSFVIVCINDESGDFHGRGFILDNMNLSDGGINQIVPDVPSVDGVVLLGVKHVHFSFLSVGRVAPPRLFILNFVFSFRLSVP